MNLTETQSVSLFLNNKVNSLQELNYILELTHLGSEDSKYKIKMAIILDY